MRIFLARQYGKLLPSSKFIGVTGSVGKTTTVIASQAVLMQKYKTISTAQTHAEMPNLDTIFNLPMTILRVRPGIEKIVLEMGIEYKGEMDFYLHLIQPQTAIVTRIANAHSEFLGDVEEIASEKGKLVASLPAAGVAILNFDDPLVKKMAETTKAKVLYFGTNSKECHVWASDIKITNFQLSFGLNYGVESVEIKSHFLGLHQVYPLLAAATLGLEASIPLMKIKKALESIAPPEHRLQPLEGYNNSIVLDDTYNAAPIALDEALDTLSRVSAHRRIAVIGEMRELGEFSEKLHRLIARKIMKEQPDLVFLGIGDTKYIAEELLNLGWNQDRLEYNLKNPEIVNKLLQVLTKGDVVLVKGARANRLDEVVSRLVGLKK